MRALVLAGIVAAGCGSDEVDLTGMYRVDTAVASMPCGNDQPVAMPPAYLKISKGEFFGATIFSMAECTDEAGTDCTGGGLFGGDSFSEPIDGGWRGVLTSWSNGGDMDPTCTLSYAVSLALLSGATLTIESTRYGEEVENTETLCTTEEAERRADAMPCELHETLEATKL